MRVLRSVAWNTFLEALRDKIFYLLVFFGIFLFGASRLLAPLALGEGRRVTLDVGLASVSIFGCLIVIFVGHQLIFREVERKTLYFLFARPIRRAEFIWGKYFGLALTLAVSVAAMGLLLAAVLWVSRYEFGFALLQALVFVFLELSILAALAVLVAAFTSPVLAGLITLAAYLIGHGSGDLLELLNQAASPPARAVLHAAAWLIPRLDLYSQMLPVLRGDPWGAGQCFYAVGYAAAYSAACLTLAATVLSRRELSL